MINLDFTDCTATTFKLLIKSTKTMKYLIKCFNYYNLVNRLVLLKRPNLCDLTFSDKLYFCGNLGRCPSNPSIKATVLL